jgi:hypothetical protein
VLIYDIRNDIQRNEEHLEEEEVEKTLIKQKKSRRDENLDSKFYRTSSHHEIDKQRSF